MLQVKNILQTSADGRYILQKGAASGVLEDCERRRLAQLIITFCLDSQPSRQITRLQFTTWAYEVPQLFALENPLSYYSSYVPADHFQTKRNASGRLYEAYNNRRRFLRKRGELPSSRRSSSGSTGSSPHPPVSAASHEELLLDDHIIQEKLHWLKSSCHPWQLTEINWNCTFGLRRKQLQEGGVTLWSYFQDFKCLQQPEGYKLVSL